MDSMNPPVVGLMRLLFDPRRQEHREAAAASERALLASALSRGLLA